MTAAFPLQWPAGVPRATERAKGASKLNMSRAATHLKEALELFERDSGLPVSGVVISSNVTLDTPMPKDTGVALYFVWDGAQRCIAVDRFPRPEQNLEAIKAVIDARRIEAMMGGLGIVRASFAGFLALPSPSDWRAVFGLGRAASIEDVEAAFRKRARASHPDVAGGSAGSMSGLLEAREAARRELGAG
ncbi:MAG: J domain-containing protein [Rhodobacteraceae bacterium]|nr:J domain-containing protein [Paracoccaceae bacterium]